MPVVIPRRLRDPGLEIHNPTGDVHINYLMGSYGLVFVSYIFNLLCLLLFINSGIDQLMKHGNQLFFNFQNLI